MKHWSAACIVLLLLGGCAAKKPTWEPPIAAVRVTFGSHLAIVRNCESRGATPTIEAAKAAGANLALVFAPAISAAPGKVNSQYAGDNATWVLLDAKPAGMAGVRAFRCPDAFIERVTAGKKRPQEVPK